MQSPSDLLQDIEIFVSWNAEDSLLPVGGSVYHISKIYCPQNPLSVGLCGGHFL